MGHSRPLFIYFRLFNAVDSRHYSIKSLLMSGIEPRTSDVGIDRFTNWATTTAHESRDLGLSFYSLIVNDKKQKRGRKRYRGGDESILIQVVGNITWQEPWSSGYWWWFMFERSWFRITLICCKNCIACLERPKIGKRKRGRGWPIFVKKQYQ